MPPSTIKPVAPGLLSQSIMLARGADGHLSRAYERYIPLDKLDGLEPTPTNNESDDGQYHSGKRITQPVEVQYDASLDVYMVYAGNHRIAQAKANGQKYILAFVEPDPQSKLNDIGVHAKATDPDAAIWKKAKPKMAESDFGQEAGAALSPEWFDQQFATKRGEDKVPKAIRALSENFCTKFQIKGICDPMYIANVAARELGSGDGRGAFNGDPTNVQPEDVERLAKRLSSSYQTCIEKSGESESPLAIITNSLRQNRKKIGSP